LGAAVAGGGERITILKSGEGRGMQDGDLEADAETLRRDGGYVEAKLIRLFWRRPDEIWTALTEPAELAKWLAPGRIEPHAGGRVRLDFAESGTVIDSEVSAFEDGRAVEFSWSREGEPLRPVRWCVAPSGVGARLTVTLKTPEGEDAARACAGWEAHLEMLEATLEGAPIGFPFERFKAAREAYKPRVAALMAGA
jgi:uncharacterized protein YndB with AHSA1/START domain